jgi:hypothetical protein
MVETYAWTKCLMEERAPTREELNETVIEKVRADYRAELSFSKYYLDDASENQSERFDRWSSLRADARALREWLERQRKYKRRHHEHEIRRLSNSNNAEDKAQLKLTYELDKVTEASLALAARRQQEVIDLDWMIFWSGRLEGVLEAAKESFDSRKAMIQVAQRLALAQYFGDVAEGRRREFEDRAAAETAVVPQTPVRRPTAPPTRRRRPTAPR